MWYGTVTESVTKEAVFYLMECPITSIVFLINMDWRTVVGISVIFLLTGFYFWSVSGFQVKKLHKCSRDPWVKYRQRHEKLWQLTNTVNQSESQTSLKSCEMIVWQWSSPLKVSAKSWTKNSFLFHIYGVCAVHDQPLFKTYLLLFLFTFLKNSQTAILWLL